MNHWEKFARFVKAELATGGPDPQLATMVRLSEGEPLAERIWLAGCYCSHHCVPSAHAVWQKWSSLDMASEAAAEVESWLGTNWHALPVRPEMKSHRLIWKRAQCLQDFAALAVEIGSSPETYRTMSYDEVWDLSIDSVRFYGRYMAIKYLELLRMLGFENCALGDLRGKNAWSPRRALALLWPDSPELANEHDKSEEAVRFVEEFTAATREMLAEHHGVSVSFFQLQVLLCEFREALAGGYYPGASLDEELVYMEQASTRFDQEPIFRARARLFEPEYLGELNNWGGLRHEKLAEWRER